MKDLKVLFGLEVICFLIVLIWCAIRGFTLVPSVMLAVIFLITLGTFFPIYKSMNKK